MLAAPAKTRSFSEVCLYAIQRKKLRAGGVAPPLFTQRAWFYRPGRHNWQSPRTLVESWSGMWDLHPPCGLHRPECELATLSPEKMVGLAGLAPAIPCSQGRCVGCYATTRNSCQATGCIRSPSDHDCSLAREVAGTKIGPHGTICTRTGPGLSRMPDLFEPRGRKLVRQPGVAPGRPLWKSGMLFKDGETDGVRTRWFTVCNAN